MFNASLLVRGQVWYWEDPVYGKKRLNSKIPIGESIVRYSRYVIIAQNTENIIKGSVLAIPCSSSNNDPNDVKIPLAHIFNSHFSYAKPRSTFPVHIRYLQKYVCTLSEDTMKLIEAEYLKMIIPSVCSAMNDSEILDKFGIDMNHVPEHYVPQSMDASIRSFAKDCLFTTTDTNAKISIYQMKDAFDLYCEKENMVNTNDIIEFIETFNRVPGIVPDNIVYENQYPTGWIGLKFQKEIVPIIMSEPEFLVKSPITQTRWNDDYILKFLKSYKEKGVDITSEEFDLKANTCKAYWYKYKNSKLKVSSINNTYVAKSISKMANIIRDTLRNDGLYAKILELQPKLKNVIDDEETFYQKLDICIYYSFLNFLFLKRNKNGEFYPLELTSDSEFISTCHFLDKIYNDRRLSNINDGKILMKLYREYYQDDRYSGIDHAWLIKLKSRIHPSFNVLSSEVLDLIANLAKETFCEIL